MVWTERQTAMLRAIGVRLWQPAALDAVADADDDPAVAVAAARADAAGSDSVAPAPARGVTGLPAPQAAPRDTGLRPPPDDARSAVEPGGASDVGTPARRALDVPGPRAAPPLRVDVAPVPAAGGPVTPSIAARGAGLDWAALRSAVEGCDACALAASRTQTVFGVGHPQAHWMVVGEAPGEQEDLRGEPFVGAAGQLLDAMLRALALSREAEGPPERRVYIANTLKCRPPRNRNPAPDELLRCEGFLVRQIELVRPRIILAMGRFAVQALLRSDEPVGKLRGRVHRYQGVPLVVTYHPAYLLRNLPDKARAWEDLCMAAAVAERAGQGG